MTWEIAPLRAAALRTERAVNKRWETLRAAIIGSALLLGVIGSAAALSLTGLSSVHGGMGFLSAASLTTSSGTPEHDVTASEARDGIADDGAPQPTTDPAPPAEDDAASGDNAPADVAPAASQPEAPRGTPTADPLPQPDPIAPAPAPAPYPTPTTQPAAAPEGDGGLLGGLLDLLLPGLLP